MRTGDQVGWEERENMVFVTGRVEGLIALLYFAQGSGQMRNESVST